MTNNRCKIGIFHERFFVYFSHINTYDCEECGMCWPTPSALKTHVLYRHSDVSIAR